MSTENLKCYKFVLIIVILMSIGFGCARARNMRRVLPHAVQGEDLFTTAEWFYKKGELERAKAFYEKYLYSEPDSLQADNALFRLGEIAMSRGDYIKSFELFQELPNRFPGSELIPSARFQAAHSLYLNLSWDSALHALERFQEDFPVSQYNPRVMLILADIFIKTREYAKAKEEIISFLRLFPESSLKYNALYLFGLGEMYLGETEEAINHLTISLTGKLPDDKRQDALYALGTLSLMKSDLLTAVEYFSDLVKSLESGERKERILKKVKDLFQERLSDEDLKAVIQRHPTDFPGDMAMMEMAERKFDQGELFDAHYYLEMVVSGFPEHPEIPSIEQKLSLFDEKHDEGTTVRKFGCIAPLTGPLSGYGEKMIRGIKMAIEEYNQVYGTSIKIVLFDSMARAENAQKGVELLAYEEKVSAIIGPLLTSTAMPTASKAERIGIPLFTPTATGEGLPELGRFVFRNCLTNRHQAEALASYAIEELGLSRFGILFPFNAYGQEMMSLFSDKVDALGANVEIIEFYDQDDTDFKDQLVRIHKVRPEALFLPGSYEKIVLIAPQIPFYEPEEPDPNDPNYSWIDLESLSQGEGSSEDPFEIKNNTDEEGEKKKKEEEEKILLLGTDGWYDQRLIKEGDYYIEGAILSVGFYPESHNPKVRQFVSNFQRRYGESPDLVSAQAYDATNMLLEASNGGEASWDRTRKNLSQIKDFPGVSGITTIMPSGDSIKEVSLLQIKGRRFVPLERPQFNLNHRIDWWE